VGNDVLPIENMGLFENRNTISGSLNGKDFGDVMVVGGGVSGIQASLDLATAGFKVYLIEKGASIGGHMAQLDKTFPTNDCSM
jgi:heterodisulfide reductase subunit A-like polyferredoxin